MFTSGIFAQKESSNIMFSYPEESEVSFYAYEPRLKIEADYKKMGEAVNEYPEQLVQSILSASNQEWVYYNTLGGEEKANKKEQSHFDRIKSMVRDKNYFELVHKLSIDVGGIPTAIIKIFTHLEDSPVLSGAFVMQKVDGRWQKTSHPALSTLSIIVMRMKTEVLEGIVLRDSEDPDIMAISERVNTDSGLDLNALEEEFASWYSPEIDERKIALFKDPETW